MLDSESFSELSLEHESTSTPNSERSDFTSQPRQEQEKEEEEEVE